MIWDLDPVLAGTGALEVRYYGVLFLLSLVVAGTMVSYFAQKAGIGVGRALTAFGCAVPAAFIASHVVHMVFYEPEALAEQPLRLLMLSSGMASHGALIGGLFASWLYARRGPRSLELVDAVMCGGIFTIPFVRVGNFTNSEAVGSEWSGPWAVAFPRYDCMFRSVDVCHAPLRHPSQLYEAAIGVSLIALAFYLQHRWRQRLRGGFITLLLVLAYSVTRFAVELVKEDFRETPILTIGGWLSVPLVLASAALLFVYRARLGREEVASSEAPAREKRRSRKARSQARRDS